MRSVAIAILVTLLSTAAFAQQFPAPATCGNVGQSVGSSMLGAIPACCAGLTAVSEWHHTNLLDHPETSCADNLKLNPAPGSGKICIVCGDGKCGTATAEDNCNCPADCK